MIRHKNTWSINSIYREGGWQLFFHLTLLSSTHEKKMFSTKTYYFWNHKNTDSKRTFNLNEVFKIG